MPGSSARQGSAGENISHFTAVRMRITGFGDLKMKMLSLDDVKTVNLTSITIPSASNIQPTRIMNFMQQRAAFRMETTEINEFFRVNRIILFTKPVFTSYPG